jgi:hypothetical protein
VTVYLWIVKAHAATLGESTSDFLVYAMVPRSPTGSGGFDEGWTPVSPRGGPNLLA